MKQTSFWTYCDKDQNVTVEDITKEYGELPHLPELKDKYKETLLILARISQLFSSSREGIEL